MACCAKARPKLSSPSSRSFRPIWNERWQLNGKTVCVCCAYRCVCIRVCLCIGTEASSAVFCVWSWFWGEGKKGQCASKARGACVVCTTKQEAPMFGNFWAWGPQPPKPPFQCPHQTKRGTNLLLFNSVSICILIKIWNWSVAELWGKSWDTDAHAHMTYRAPKTGLHSPTLLPFFSGFHWISCWHNPVSLEWIAAPLVWLIPRPAPKRVCLWLSDMSTDPPPLLPNLLKKGGE